MREEIFQIVRALAPRATVLAPVEPNKIRVQSSDGGVFDILITEFNNAAEIDPTLTVLAISEETNFVTLLAAFRAASSTAPICKPEDRLARMPVNRWKQ